MTFGEHTVAGDLGPASPLVPFWRALWLRTAVRGLVLVGLYFAAWELVEHSALAEASAPAIRILHLARGAGGAFLLGTWSFFMIRQARRDRDATMEAAVAQLEARAQILEAHVRHQEKMAGLGILTAGFAHDLGNPLASLSTELELLETEDDVEAMRRSLGVLREHVSRMIRTLREMVDFARRRRDAVTDVSVACAVADSSRLVCHDPRWKRMELVVDVASDLPTVRMVEDHLVLVLVNLMLNAADAMPRGGTLTVSARRRGAAVELVVSDTGEGMAPETLARAKTPLFTTKGSRGTGLGLPVCEDIVSSVGGGLALESTPGAGTRVIVRLPIAGGADA